MILPWTMVLGLLLVSASSALAQETELEECLDQGTFCSESAPILMDESCGEKFYRFRGRITWPPLLNVGPVTISVRTRALLFQTPYPLYLEIIARDSTFPDECVTYIGGSVILVGQGANQCGGTWETFGPVDLRGFGVPIGGQYNLQAVFFEQFGHHPVLHSVGLSCIRVTAHPDTTAVAPGSWSQLKSLYR